MTQAELTLLRSLAETDVVTFTPGGTSAAALATYEATVESLPIMQKAGWIKLEVNEDWVTLQVARVCVVRPCRAVAPLDFGLTAGCH